jgi:hypothetical protein
MPINGLLASIQLLAQVFLLVSTVAGPWLVPHASAEGIDFTGTVLLADPAAGKLAVKKTGGGTRFTFIVNDKTQFEGAKGLGHLKKDDVVTVQYQVVGAQYIALKVVAKK